MKRTRQQYNSFQRAFDYFNQKLFHGKLETVILSFSRRANSKGFFIPNRWKGETKNARHEISLNPQFLKQEPRLVYSTLVHELVHLWQHQYGKPSPNNYHNLEWSIKMESLGLIPSKTGKPGGEKTGRPMSHYVKSGGLYDKAFKEMNEDYFLPFRSFEGWRSGKQKLKYMCYSCESAAWTNKPTKLICGICNVTMSIVNI